MTASAQPKLIAFYLPQFHPIPENDEWWGKGFTEWRNVARAKPLFRDHYQPHLPADLGFYDLRVPEVREQQAALAKQYGIYGFCYYYYWFNGRRLLERPLDEVVALGKPDFPFCICWANETWSRRWDGSENEILIAQLHTHESDVRFILDVLPILKDPRYIRVDGKPMLLIYRVELLPRPVETATTWRRIAADNGLPGLHLCTVESFTKLDPRQIGFDAAVEFAPLGLMIADSEHLVTGVPLHFRGSVLDYRDTVREALARPAPEYRLHRCLMATWDNTPRRGSGGYVFQNATPENYGNWLSALVQNARTREDASEFIFVNAWNEWAEGAHLEPDLKNGHAFLKATRQALELPSSEERKSAAAVKATVRNAPLVSVLVLSHGEGRFIRDTIASVEKQTYENIELIVIDDGSTPESAAIVERSLSETGFRRVTFRSQPKLGDSMALDRGVMLAAGDYVAILDEGDLFVAERLAALTQEAATHPEALLFSGVSFLGAGDKRSTRLDEVDPELQWYRDALRVAALAPTAGFGILCGHLTASISNLFFARALFDRVRGFNAESDDALDWDFALRATRYGEPRFIPENLVNVRHRHCNTLAPNFDLDHESALNELAPTRENWPIFFDFFQSTVMEWAGPGWRFTRLSDVDATDHFGTNGFAKWQTRTGKDQLAIDRVMLAIREGHHTLKPLADLRHQIARNWANSPN